MLAGERAGGERKIIMCRGTPAHFFFQCIISHFQASHFFKGVPGRVGQLARALERRRRLKV